MRPIRIEVHVLHYLAYKLNVCMCSSNNLCVYACIIFIYVSLYQCMRAAEKEAARDRGRMVRVAQLEHERQRLLQTLEAFEEVGGSSPRHVTTRQKYF